MSVYPADDGRFYELWDGITATNSPPSAVTDGIEIPRDNLHEAVIMIYATAGTTPGVTARAWVYQAGGIDLWFPLGLDPSGSGSATAAGVLNDGNAIGNYSGNNLVHTEALSSLSAFRRFYLEATAITGTSTPTFSAYLGAVGQG